MKLDIDDDVERRNETSYRFLLSNLRKKNRK